MWYFSTTLHILTYKVSQLTNVNLTSMICSAIWNLLEKMKNKQDISTLNSGLIKWDECVHAQLCLTLCNPTDYLSRLLCPWNSQARILEWIAIPFSRRSSQPRDWTCISYVSYIGRQILYHLSHQGSPSNGIIVLLFSHPVMSDSLWHHTYSMPGLTISPSLPKLTALVMPSRHFILWHPLLLLASIFPSIRVFSNMSAVCIRWQKYWSFSFSISPSSEYLGLISLKIDWFDLLAIQGTFRGFLQNYSSKASILWHSVFFMAQLSVVYDHWEDHSLGYTDFFLAK